MSFAIKGKIVDSLQEVTGTSARGEWRRKEFVIETDEQYPKKICFTLFNDKITLLEGYEVGADVEVSFNLESREYQGRYFHNVNAWKIDPITAEAGGEAMGGFPESIPTADAAASNDEGGDLPF